MMNFSKLVIPIKNLLRIFLSKFEEKNKYYLNKKISLITNIYIQNS